MTEQQMETLRVDMAKIERIDPCSETYKKMIKLLDGMPQSLLKQIAGAKIKFLSMLAKHRVKD